MMSKRPWIFLGLAVIALLVQHYSLKHSPQIDLEGEARAFAQQSESAVQPWLEADSIWLTHDHQPSASLWARTDWPEGFAFFLHRADSLHFWTDYQLPWPSKQITPSTVLLLPPQQRPHYLTHRSLPNGWTVSAAAPVPRSIPIAKKDHRLLTADSWTIKQPDQPDQPLSWQISALLGWLLGSLAFLLFLDTLSRFVADRITPLAGIASATAGLLLWWKVLPYGHYPAFPSLQLVMNAPFFRWSLAHLLVLPPILLWLFSLSQRLFREQALPFENQRWSSFFSTAAYLSMVVGLLFCGATFKTLLLESGLSFDFNNVLELSRAAFAAMGAIVFLLLLLLLYSLWMVRRVHLLQVQRNQRLISLAVALVLSLPIAWFLALGIGLLPLTLLALLYIALLDLFVEIKAASPAWLLLWLAILSAFSAGLLFKYSLDEGRDQRLHFAQKMTYPVDDEAEQSLEQLSRELHTLPQLQQLDSLLLYLPYLNKNFRWQWLSAAQQQRLELGEIKGRYAILPPNAHYYTYGLKKGGSDSLLVFQPKLQQSRRVIKQLVGDAPQQASRYQLSLYHDSTLIAQRGYFLRDWLDQGEWPTVGNSREQLNSQRANLYYRPGNGYTVIVGENLGGYIKPISLFSYLFALLTLAALLLFSANRLYPFLPATPGHLLFGPPSLRHRVQLSVIVLTLFAFLVISIVTVVSLQQSSQATQTERLLDKVEVLLRDMPFATDSLIQPQQLRALSEVHQVDISCFDAKGRLISSSVPFLFADGWQAPRINPEALRAKQRQGYKPAIIPEQAGSLSYLAAYVPVRQANGEDWLFRIPFTSAERSVQRAALGFVGNLLNVYVFLLLIAGAIAITVANSITRPLMKIGEKLRSFQLGQNEPLEWDSEDEIGKLVAEYNAMIAKLEESAEKLRQSEREGAWREMAKQVAHEIKNPLTPMKLSIQYLQHAQKSDPERAASMISSVSKTLIEQIDGLAHIATAFSNFAQMPKAENERFSLNEAVQNIYKLFTEHQEPLENFHLEISQEHLYVLADKNHLNRVLTNLLKNAQQAIPEDRQGEILLTLEREGEQAVISVQDNGSGIPESIQPKVFQPNFTTKSSGMGLGLAMCKSMMEAAGGTISFETKQGEGTIFTVVLPLAE
jgi:signal transduction histidine kinase